MDNDDEVMTEQAVDVTAGEFEVEKDESNPGVTRPWDPSLIRVDPKMFSLRQIIDMIDEGELDLAPDFQRHRVWGRMQKSRLIESILLRIPLPAFYFSADVSGRMQVVDGLQRLSTVHAFAKDAFALEQLEYLQDQLTGKKFSEAKDTVWGRRFHTTQIIVNVIDPQTPPKVKFDIFKRINTLGEPLTAQEIRHCMSQQVSREFLKRCANSLDFLEATTRSLLDHKRMADREAVLRFVAFRTIGDIDAYDAADSMDGFLTEATARLDASSDEERATLQRDLARASLNARRLFGSRAFRKWPEGADDSRVNPINKSLLEAWLVGLAGFEWEEIGARGAAIVEQARRAMKEDWAFNEAISAGTGDPRKVKLRFSHVRRIIEEAGIVHPFPASDALAPSP